MQETESAHDDGLDLSPVKDWLCINYGEVPKKSEIRWKYWSLNILDPTLCKLFVYITPTYESTSKDANIKTYNFNENDTFVFSVGQNYIFFNFHQIQIIVLLIKYNPNKNINSKLR